MESTCITNRRIVRLYEMEGVHVIWEWLAKGILLGLSIAAPVGPISILCVKKTLTSGFKTGLFCGLGAATADAIYGSIAGFGLSAVTSLLMEYKTVLQAAGGLFICYLGIRSLLLAPRTESVETSAEKDSSLRSYVMTLLLTLSNPITIVFFLGVFGASRILMSQSGTGMPAFIGGVFLGSGLWWVCLTGAAAVFRINLSTSYRRFNLFNKLSGVVMLCFGIPALAQALGY